MKTSNKRNWLIAAATVMMTATFLVWPMHYGQAQKKNNTADVRKSDGTNNDYDQDSTKRKRKYNDDGGTDEQVRVAQQQVDAAMAQVDAAMKQLGNLDIGKTVSDALKSVDFDNIKVQVDAALKNVDLKAEINNAMANVDMKNIQVEIDKAMANVDMKKIQKNVHKAMKSIDWTDMKREIAVSMKEINSIDKDEIRNAMREAKIEIDNAKVKIGDAKIRLKNMKRMTHEMKKDGLIDDTNHLNINWKNGKLFINGQQQPDNVSEKYRKYIDEDGSMNIDKDDDNDL